jgi:signal transduction histidine kinase/ligand-binding sensor domain-containing protein/DNA-binding response OmpR family regulator
MFANYLGYLNYAAEKVFMSLHPFKNIKIFIISIFLAVFAAKPFCFPQPIENNTAEQIAHSSGKNSGTYTGFDPVFQTLPTNFEYNGVRCILKDHKGFMWFGTDEGLIRYDGINLYVFQHDPEDSASIRHNNVNAMVEDPENRLWIGTSRGLNLYNRALDNFISVGNLSADINRLNNNYVSALNSDTNSFIWIGTFGDGVNVYDPEKNTVLHLGYNTDNPNTISSNRITCIVVDNKNRVWLGTQNGLNLYSEKNTGFRKFYNEPGNPGSLGGNNISSLAFDPEQNLWIGTRGGGLNKLSCREDNFIFKRYSDSSQPYGLSNNYVLSLVADAGKNLWIGTENGGLNRLDLGTGYIDIYLVAEGYANSINSNSIWSLFNDNEGRIWIGTATRGVNVIDEKFNKFESYQKNIANQYSLTDNDVKGFAEDSRGNIWIAMDGGGICMFNPETKQFSNFIDNEPDKNCLTNNAIQGIHCDPDDNLWIATWAGGVDRLNKDGKTFRNYKLENEEGGGNNNIIYLSADSKGNIWAGTSGSGLFRYNKKEDRFIQLVSDNHTNILTPASYVTSFLEDMEGTYWIGTLNGLVRINVTNGKYLCKDIPHSTLRNTISSKMIEVIFEDSRGRLWLGTSDNGLNLFNKQDETAITFRKTDGLPGNSIRGILEDNDGGLWVATNRGLCHFNYDSLSFTSYTKEDGLNSNELFSRSCLRTRDGKFYFGGENGFNAFYPKDITKNNFIPPVYLSNLKINNATAKIGAKDSPLNKHIWETREIVLNHKQSSFTIEFVALNYTRSARNKYTYKLEGFDTEWNYISNNRSATYTKIAPGKYTFMVKGSNNDGIWNNTPTLLHIKIKPPLWKTWWAILLYVFLISSMIAFSLRIWHERVKIKNQLMLEQLGREKEHELNELNIQFFTNISHEFRTPLSLIIAPLENILLSAESKIKEQLVIIYRNAQRLLQLTNNLMDFRKLEEGITNLQVKPGEITGFISEVSAYFNVSAKRRRISYKIESPESAIHGWFDPDKLETILLNLLSNAFKNTPDSGKIRIGAGILNSNDLKEKYGHTPIHIQPDSRYIEISVIDNGTGISAEELPHIFEKFYQSKSHKNRKGAGTGIGLTLTKGLVELHHGFILATSKPRSKTSFTMVLPIDEIAYPEYELVNEPTSVLNRTVLNESESNTISGRKKEVFNPKENEEKTNLLIVEDNYELRSFLAKELSRKYNITGAEDGREGIETAFRILPDLIISDILMPQCSGIDLCKVIKSDLRTCHIPIILLTAKTTISEQIEGVETGADAYVTKPFNMQFLYARVDQLISSRRKLYAHFSQDVYIMPNKMADNELDQGFLQKVIDYIIVNIADNTLDVEELAGALNLSRSNVYRKIKALTGKTIIEFIRIVRLKQAIKLMDSKKHSLAEIAYLTGFTSPSYFTKSFKDQYGKPPSEYLP